MRLFKRSENGSKLIEKMLRSIKRCSKGLHDGLLFLWRVGSFLFIKVRKDSLFSHAAAISFSVLLYFIPLSMMLISVSTFFFKAEGEGVHLFLVNLKKIVPFIEFRPIIVELQKVVAGRGLLGIFGFIFLAYLSSKIFIMLQQAIHSIFGTHYKRGFFRDYFLSFFIILSLILVYFLFSAAGPLLGVIQSILLELGVSSVLFSYLTSALLFMLTLFLSVIFLFLLYYFIPGRKVTVRQAFWGAFFAAFIWVLGRYLFTWYLGYAASYSVLYGAYSMFVLFLLWIYFTSFIAVFGAELVSLMVLYQRKNRIVSNGGSEKSSKE